MISFEKAFREVMKHTQEWGNEQVPLLESTGRVLAAPILADRDFPPFDRATRDGIAICSTALEKGKTAFPIVGMQSAGMPQQQIGSPDHCMEVMTGAMVPLNTDTVIMYEKISLEDGIAKITGNPKKGQNIHRKGSDLKKGEVILPGDIRITAAEIGVLATVGQDYVTVKKMPKIGVISTGNELVDISTIPLPHQIRKSNVLSLYAALSRENIRPELIHLKDERTVLQERVSKAIRENDVLLLSGGVSKGKFDFVPEVLEALGVAKTFHRVAQRPGKPFWFGVQEVLGTTVFSFPGNPVSTYANYHIYFVPWLYRSLGLPYPNREVILYEAIANTLPLTRFVQVKTFWKNGSLYAKPIQDGGSGDMASLTRSDGFIRLAPKENAHKKGSMVPYIPK
ncbi:MAG: molybdopterin molybdotransferase MoeA [Bacteroidota bacterium]